jgi:serine/threonine protein kinase
MDIIADICLSVVGGIASHAGQSIAVRVKDWLYEAFKDKSDRNIYDALAAAGNLADTDIRKRVSELTAQKKLSAPQAEELATLLINLAHGARAHSTHGSLRSTFVRCERLIDQLLQGILPARRKGEPVAQNALADWTLERFLGMGTFGEVWEARNTAFPEPRAVKFFTRDDAAQWIRAEQETLFHVRKNLPKHANLIDFEDVALSGKPHPFLVLEYAAGGSLEEWLLRSPQERPKLDLRRVVEGIIRGLAQAHEKGIAHRDLKPANVLLGGEQPHLVPKIADFGLGRVHTTKAETSAQASQTGQAGTSMYLPPEAMQVFEKRSAEKDDVFAVGVIWYQLLVNKLERPPYDFADRLRAHLADSQTIRVIERCLAQPARRFADALELQEAFDSIPDVPDWEIPPGCFDVQHLAREYLASKA